MFQILFRRSCKNPSKKKTIFPCLFPDFSRRAMEEPSRNPSPWSLGMASFRGGFLRHAKKSLYFPDGQVPPRKDFPTPEGATICQPLPGRWENFPRRFYDFSRNFWQLGKSDFVVVMAVKVSATEKQPLQIIYCDGYVDCH